MVPVNINYIQHPPTHYVVIMGHPLYTPSLFLTVCKIGMKNLTLQDNGNLNPLYRACDVVDAQHTHDLSPSFFPSPCAPAGFVLLPVPVQPAQHFCCSTSTSLFCDYFILTSPSPQSTSIPFSFSCESLAQATCSWLFVDFFLGQWFSIGGCLESFDSHAWRGSAHTASG